MNKQLNNLLQKQMNRKDFLKYMGAASLVVTGISGITKALLHSDELMGGKSGAGTASAAQKNSSVQGYGGGTYGSK